MNSIPPDDDYPETLILEAGDGVRGAFRYLTTGTTKKGEQRAIAVLEVDDKLRSLWLHETALRRQFAQVQPKRDERVIIRKAADKKKSENGSFYGRSAC